MSFERFFTCDRHNARLGIYDNTVIAQRTCNALSKALSVLLYFQAYFPVKGNSPRWYPHLPTFPDSIPVIE